MHCFNKATVFFFNAGRRSRLDSSGTSKSLLSLALPAITAGFLDWLLPRITPRRRCCSCPSFAWFFEPWRLPQERSRMG